MVDATDVLLGLVFASALGLYFYSAWASSPSSSALTRKAPAPAAKQPTKAPVRPTKTRSIVQKLAEAGKQVVVFFGSQTGTAEDFAGRLVKEGQQLGIGCMTADPEDYDMDELAKLPSTVLCIFVVATYGEGEPTDNAVSFMELLKDPPGDDFDLTNLRYTVFGLGNKTYEHFNAIARIVDSRLAEMGGVRIAEKGEGDDDGSLEDDFVAWKEKMWPLACELFGIDMSKVSKESVRAYALKPVDTSSLDSAKVFSGEMGPKLKAGSLQTRPPYDAKNPYYSTLVVRRNLTAEDEGGVARHGGVEHRVVHAELSAPKGESITYKTGDHVAVYPCNDTDLVDRYLRAFGVQGEEVFSLTAIDPAAPKKTLFPCPTTYRACLTHYLDLTTPPRSNVVRLLSEWASDPAQKARLELMASSSAEGRELYHSHIVEGARTLVDLLEEFGSVNVAEDGQDRVGGVLEVMPRMQARYYSISSSPKAHPDSIHITFSVVQFRATGTPDTLRKGVATSWLDTLPIGTRVPIYIRSSNFKLPRTAKTPVIMVGPGTGVAPFRAFVQDRVAESSEGRGETMLFFGARSEKHDFLYREEWQEAVEKGGLILRTAFSRDNPEGKKVYVQHRMWEYRDELWKLLNEKAAIFYVCGDAKNMAREVQATLTRIATEVGGKDEAAATAWVKDLRKNKRYLEDVWS